MSKIKILAVYSCDCPVFEIDKDLTSRGIKTHISAVISYRFDASNFRYKLETKSCEVTFLPKDEYPNNWRGALAGVYFDPPLEMIRCNHFKCFSSKESLVDYIVEKEIEPMKKRNRKDYSNTFAYCFNDVKTTDWIPAPEIVDEFTVANITNVVFNEPATIVFWSDGTKTVVKIQDGEEFDKEKGLAMAIAKKILGSNKSKSNYYNVFRKWIPELEPAKKTKDTDDLEDNIINKCLKLTEEGLTNYINALFGFMPDNDSNEKGEI